MTSVFFTDSYDDARANFHKAITDAQNSPSTVFEIELSEHEIVDSCFCDIATFMAKDTAVIENLVLHISGTHGVEGFAGSAIQTASIPDIANGTVKIPERTALIVVHALNAFGMRHNRRWNENNVDLNRNNIDDPEVFSRQRHEPTRVQPYDKFDHVMNPSSVVNSWWSRNVGFLSQAAWNIIVHGKPTLRLAIVGGQYHNSRGLFYGGVEKQRSHVVLSDFLDAFIAKHTGGKGPSGIKRFSAIDVHTGLGPPGQDSLGFGQDPDGARLAQECKLLVPEHDDKFIVQGNSDTFQGYDKALGGTPTNICARFDRSRTNVFQVTQEFGTIADVMVLRALREENASWHFGTDADRELSGRMCRDAFYLRGNADWEESVLSHGRRLLTRVLQSAHQSPK